MVSATQPAERFPLGPPRLSTPRLSGSPLSGGMKPQRGGAEVLCAVSSKARPRNHDKAPEDRELPRFSFLRSPHV
jgi:hypothetical protein